MALDSTPASFIENYFGGCRALTEDLIPQVLSEASSHGMLDITVDYVRYRRPDLDGAIQASLEQGGK